MSLVLQLLQGNGRVAINGKNLLIRLVANRGTGKKVPIKVVSSMQVGQKEEHRSVSIEVLPGGFIGGQSYDVAISFSEAGNQVVVPWESIRDTKESS